MSKPNETDDDYRSSDDEDYKPENVEDDVEEPSGDECDEVSAKDGGILTVKRRAKGGPVAPAELAKPSSKDDVDAIFAELMGFDPIEEQIKKNEAAKKKDSEQASSSSVSVAESPSKLSDGSQEEPSPASDKVVVRETYDFAGEEHTIEKEVTTEEYEQIMKRDKLREEKSKKPMTKRTGLGEALTLISKKPKMSILDKSNHDWDTFKKDNNIKEELEQHNKGKGGYLNKMDFLTRVDRNEFEQEKEMRKVARKNC